MTDAPNVPRPAGGDAAKLMIVQRISLIVDVLLICGCTYLLVGDILQALSAMLEFASRGGAFLVNLTASFALLQRSMSLLRRFSLVSAGRTAGGVNVWTITLMLALPLLTASALELLVHGAHRTQLETLVEAIAARSSTALATKGQVSAADLATLRGPYLQALTVRTDSGAFLLKARIPALDAAGFAARYSSTEGEWYIDPYDSAAQTSPLFDARGPTLTCKTVNEQLSCERGTQ
jgi:hypothetical protein